MKILIAALAESANIGPSGRLHIRGVVDTLVAQRGFPWTLPPLTVVLRLELDHNESALNHVIRVDVLDHEGKVLDSIRDAYPSSTKTGRRTFVNEILPLQLEEPVTQPGGLSFKIFWDDRKQLRLELEIVGGRD